MATEISIPDPTVPPAPDDVDVATTSIEPSPSSPDGRDEREQRDEYNVSILVSGTGLGSDGQTSPIGFGVGSANQDVSFDGSPFAGTGGIVAPLYFRTESDLTADLDLMRGVVGDLLTESEADLFVAALPPAVHSETIDLAAQRQIPTVIVNHIADGTADRSEFLVDLAGSADLMFDALVEAVVAGEHDGIVVVGPTGSPKTLYIEELLRRVGSDPVFLAAPDSPPSPATLADALGTIEATGDRPAVIVLSQGWAAPLVDATASARSAPLYFATDMSLSRSEISSIDTFGEGEITVVRRVDGLARPEQAGFEERLFADQSPDATDFAAHSYDAYALGAIAAAAVGEADGSTLRAGMIEASRSGQVCTTLEECLTLAAAGTDVDYDGVSGPIDLDDDGVATAMWLSIDVVDPVTGGDASSRFVLQRR